MTYPTKPKEQELEFGDRVSIEMKRYGIQNEHYTHKVIAVFRSNTYVDVPVQTPAEEKIHGQVVVVVSCICEGVKETKVLKYRLEDVELLKNYRIAKAIKTERNRIVEIIKKSMCDFCTYDNKLWSNSTEKYIKCTGLKHVLLKALENKGKDE